MQFQKQHLVLKDQGSILNNTSFKHYSAHYYILI